MAKPKNGKSEKPILSEKDFILDIAENIQTLQSIIKLPAIKNIHVEKELRKGFLEGNTKRLPTKYRNGILVPRVDILIEHKNKKVLTIIETKIYKSITTLTTGIGQLLFYQEYIKRFVGKDTKAKAILISNHIPRDDALAQITEKNNLDVLFIEWNENSISWLKPQNQGGRSSIWEDPYKMEKAITDYFSRSTKPTMAGLAYALGIGRKTLYEYEDKKKFSYIIKKARMYIESQYEENLVYGDKPTGVIFALKNMGWKDRTDITSDDKPVPSPIYGGKSTSEQ